MYLSYVNNGQVIFSNTVHIAENLDIFVRVLFSQNFAYAKFRENKILKKWPYHFVFYGYR